MVSHEIAVKVGVLSEGLTGEIATSELTWLLGGLSSLRAVGLSALRTVCCPQWVSPQHDGLLHQSQQVKKTVGEMEVIILCT